MRLSQLFKPSFVVTYCLLALIFYFTYHTIIGERGFLAMIKLNAELAEKQDKLEGVKAERLNLEHQVNLLKNESLDLDLVDQQSREMLGFANEDEMVTIINE